MRHFDFAPLYKSTIGFDHLAAVLNGFAGAESDGYPPYNIERTGDNDYRIAMAVAGLSRDDVTIEQKEQVLTVRAKPEDRGVERTYLHRGIATRAFDRRFRLAEHVEVVRAEMENGVLTIDLTRNVPEALKARTIAIEAPALSAPEAAPAA